ncbi:hypothetical protein [Gemmiger sp.]
MKKKRILCGAVAAAMTVSLAACSKGQTDAAPVTSTAAAETETTTAANAATNSTYTGTVTAVSAASLTLSTESDGDITVPLTDATTYTRGGMGGGQAPDGNPPELPSDGSGDSRNGGTPPELPADAPEKPDGAAPDGQPGGEAEALSYESISVGDTVTVTVGDDGSAATEFTADDTLDGAAYASTGTGSPAIYSTADISVNNATLTANGSEAVCIEGLNTIRLFNCTLSGNMPANAQNDCDWNVILYQSMSGDSEQGNSTFEMVGGSLTANNGGMFYTTNTESTFLLDGVDITPSAENDFFLKCTGNANARGWGQSGANGADCSFTARNQAMEGDVIWDSISQLDFYMLDGSTLTGAVLDDETNAGSGGDGCANLYISADSTWVVTGDSVLTNLYSAGTIVDTQGRAVTIKDTNGTVLVQGTSDCTVTVSGYSATVDDSGASVSDSFSEYAVAKS